MPSPAIRRRLQHFTSAVLADAAPHVRAEPCKGRSLWDAEGEAAIRFGGARVTILEIGQRGVPLMALSKSSVDDNFKRRGLDPVFVHKLEEIPPDTSIIVTTGAAVGQDVLAKAPSLKLVASALTGVDHIDIKACQARNIRVCNVPDYSTEATAQLAIGLVLSHLNHIPQCHKTIIDGMWAAPPQEDLSTKTVGIVGVGKIGMRLAALFKAFNVKGLRGFDMKWQETEFVGLPGWSPRSIGNQDSEFTGLGGSVSDSLAGIFLDADIICICMPLTEKTEGLISEKVLKLLRPNSVLVNVSRGGIIDEVALADLLGKGHFRAALDVFGVEPLPKDSPLRSVPQDSLIMTPHVGHQSPASLEKRLDGTVKNILAFVVGQAQNIVA